jgi:hypothetical protein
MAGISMAAMNRHADNVSAHRFTSDPALISFRILILVSLEVSPHVAARLRNSKTLVVLLRHKHRTNAALMRVDDSRPPTDEYKNGMNAPRSVMKAAG